MVRSEKGYGFNLHSTRLRPGQYIRSFDPGSPADLAGLRRQDRVIEVATRRRANENMQLPSSQFLLSSPVSYGGVATKLQQGRAQFVGS